MIMAGSTDTTLDEIKGECEIIWERIQETHHRLESHLDVAGGTKDNISMKRLQHKERRLKAALENLKDQDIEVFSKDPKCWETLLQNNATKTKDQLDVNLGIIKQQRQELAREIQRQKKHLEEQQQQQEALQRQIQAYQGREDVEQPKHKVLEDLQKRKKQAKEYNDKCMKRLGTFVSTHFPELDCDKKNTGKRPKSYCTLLHLIEILLNRLFENPHNPYIEQLPTYWPPYIELLLRYGVIQRHPNDCNLICLVGYHFK